jgi:transcriptional regulator with XRE-family HTH domain
MTQQEFAAEAEMKQPRISAMENPGATKFNIETLVRLAAAFRVGLIVRFVPVSEMIDWENGFSQDSFSVTPFESDLGLRNPGNRFVASFSFNSAMPGPGWLSQKTLRAAPRPDINTTIASVPADAGNTATVQSFQLQLNQVA